MLNRKLLEERKNFCHNIVWLRQYYCIPKKRMAQLLGIGVGSLNKIERGELPPKLSMAIIDYVDRNFSVSPNKLLGSRFGE